MADKHLNKEGLQYLVNKVVEELNKKVDTKTGMGLSHNDLTDDLLNTINSTASKVENLENTGGQPNVIEVVKVNGTAVTPSEKAVNITVPTKVSDIANDSNYQTDVQVATTVQQAIAATGHAKFVEVDAVPSYAEAQDNVFYLVMNATTNHYDIYAKVGTNVVLLDDTTVDLSGYVKSEDIEFITTSEIDAMFNPS